MVASLDGDLKKVGSSISSAKDREFVNSRKVVEAKACFLREQGYSKRPRALKALTTEDRELLWSKGLLGSQSPKSLITTMRFVFTQHFGLRGCQEHHNMYDRVFYSAKTTTASSTSCSKKIPKKRVRTAFGKNEEWFRRNCLQLMGQILKTFLSHSPREMKSSGPFYLAVIERPRS